MVSFRSIALAGLLSVLSGSGVLAADAAFPPIEEAPAVVSDPVEFGTGWYLRGDLGWTRGAKPPLSFDTASVSQAMNANGWSIDLGGGYRFNNWLRADVVLDWRSQVNASLTGATITCPYQLTGLTQGGVPVGYIWDATQGTCSPVQSAALQSGDLLLNGYVDLGTWSRITPYVGAGLGVAYLHSKGSMNYLRTSDGMPYAANLTSNGAFPQTWVSPTGAVLSPQPTVGFGQQTSTRGLTLSRYNFAWAVMGGVAVDIADGLKLDIGYRYLDLGRFTSASGASYGQTVTRRVTSQEVRAGIRYMLDE